MTKTPRTINQTVFLLAGLLALCGCGPTPEEAALDTDRRAYRAIDRAMSRAGMEQNDYYRVDDPNDRQVARVEPPETGVLTLSQAAAMAVSNNREYLLERDNLYTLATGVTEIQHLYEPIPIGFGQTGYVRQDNYQDNPEDVEGVGSGVGFGLSRLLATGAQVGTQMTIGWVDLLSGDGDSGFSSVFSAVATQPLLRGSSHKAVFETLTQAEQDLLYQIRYFNRYRKTFIVSVVQTYYETLHLYDRMNNARRYYLTLLEVCRQTQKQAAVGRVPLFEVEEATQDQLDALNIYHDIRNDYGETLDLLKTMLAIRPDTEFILDTRELDALRETGFSEMDFSEEAAIRAALNQRLDLANAADRVLDAQRHTEIAAEMLGVDLSLFGQTNITSGGNMVEDLESPEDLYGVGLRLDLPLDRLAEKNQYRLTLVELMQNQRTYQGVTDTAIMEVRAAFRNLRTAHEKYRVALESQDLAQKRTENTLRLQKVGRANMRDVLDAQEDYYKSQDAVTEALVQYAVASLNLYLATDTLKVQPDGQLNKADCNFLAKTSANTN
ncbi:MAG: TolC family protein [Planctomycetales bacterium]|nr:TolC family protein [Planctomycetales bacterium]